MRVMPTKGGPRYEGGMPVSQPYVIPRMANFFGQNLQNERRIVRTPTKTILKILFILSKNLIRTELTKWTKWLQRIRNLLLPEIRNILFILSKNLIRTESTK